MVGPGKDTLLFYSLRPFRPNVPSPAVCRDIQTYIQTDKKTFIQTVKQIYGQTDRQERHCQQRSVCTLCDAIYSDDVIHGLLLFGVLPLFILP